MGTDKLGLFLSYQKNNQNKPKRSKSVKNCKVKRKA